MKRIHCAVALAIAFAFDVIESITSRARARSFKEPGDGYLSCR